jgi:methyl-accepting chemotaxis protein
MSVLGHKIKIGILATPIVLTVVLVSISLAAINSLGKDSLREKGGSLAVVTAEAVKAGVQYGVFDDAEKLLEQLIANGGDVSAAAIVVQDGKGVAVDKVKKFAKGYESADLAGAAKALLAAPLAKKGEPVFLGGGEPQFIAARIDLTANDQIQSGFLLLGLNSKRISADINKTFLVMIGAGGLMMALGAFISLMISRAIIGSIGGEPGDAVDVTRRIASGDLSKPIAVQAGDTNSLMAQLKAMQDSLSRVVSNVRNNSEAVASASQQIAQGNQDLSQRTEQQASALQETAASMEQLGSTVKQNADSAKQANQLALGASTVAIKGGEVVGQAVNTMKGINDASKKIADIIGVIDGIAFQTNILALNAAVEAARAGEQGRGFAVVASEVRNLAGRSAEAAKEIKSLITASVERVEQGTALVDQAGVTMTEVVNSIKRVTDIMGEISAASTEQSSGVAQVGQAVSQMDHATQQNAALVEESAAAAESLRNQAQQLVQAVAVFKLESSADRAGTQAAPAFAQARAQTRDRPLVKSPTKAGTPAPATAQKAAKPVRIEAAERPRAASPEALCASAATDDWASF